MGNRGNVIFHNGKEISCNIYCHWNGGAESIYNFIAEGNKRKSISHCVDYAAARFIQIVGEFMDGDGNQDGTSLGVVNGPKAITIKELRKVQTDSGDNGFFVFDIRDWSCRRFTEHAKKNGNDYTFTLVEMSKKNVAKEFEEAKKSAYTKEFAEFFDKLRYKKYGVIADKNPVVIKDMAIRDFVTI